MKIRKIAMAALAVALTVSISGCAKRRIDIEETGSQRVPGTTWQILCDGPNAVMWVPGRSGEDDEIEAYVYDHWHCAPSFYEENPDADPIGTTDPAQGDPDGIVTDEED